MTPQERATAIKFAKFIANHEDSEGDKLSLQDGKWRWRLDDEGDMPLSEEMLFELFKKSLTPHKVIYDK
jgi:hypothetical protein